MPTSDSHDSNDSQTAGIDPEVLGRHPDGDAVAWATSFAAIYERACLLIERALVGGPGGGSEEVRRLIQAYRRDPEQIPGALLSAQTTFRRHFQADGGPEVRAEDDPVAVLIRVTYNRWQRQNIRDKRLRDQTATGAGRGGDEDATRIEQVADPRPGPEQPVETADFLEKLEEEAHLFCRGSHQVDRQIVFLLVRQLSPKEIQARLKVSQARISRIRTLLCMHLVQRMHSSLG